MKPIGIYIVEDELLISASLKSQLQHFGYEILGSATRGETCLEDIKVLSEAGREPEIILMDIHLRGNLDGIDTARLIHEQFNCGVIFLTGQSSKEVYERSFSIKPFGYLLKPIDMEQTKMTIEIAAYQRNLELENKIYQHELERLLERRTSEIGERMATYKEILEHSRIGQAIVCEGMFLYANKRLAHLVGMPDQDFSGHPISLFTRLLPPVDLDRLSWLKETPVQGEATAFRLPLNITRADGACKELQLLADQITFEEKSAIHLVLVETNNLNDFNK